MHISKKDQDYINYLLKSAELNLYPGQRLASLVVIKSRMFPIGFNQRKTHPMQKRYADNKDREYIHAEINGLVNALNFIRPKELNKATLYVARLKKSNVPGLAKPCLGCMNAIRAFGINRVIYSTDEENVLEGIYLNG